MNYLEFREKFKSVSVFPNGSWIISDRMKEIAKFTIDLIEFFDPKFKFVVLPADDPLEGKIGFTVFIPENPTKSFKLQLPITWETQIKEYENVEEFYKAFSEAWESKIPIETYDNPIKRLAGFITTNRDERIWHCIAGMKLKEETDGK